MLKRDFISGMSAVLLQDVAAGNLVKKKPRIEPVERKVSIFPSERAQLSIARKKSSFRRETRVTSSGALFVSRHDLREVGRSSGRASMSLAKHFGRK